ncbi:hypothetical protein ACHQM5_018594 [Ranunculus cassubicifolius]
MENLPPGFRFHPTDEELITYYLSHKVSDFRFVSRAIADVDLNKWEPWDLPDKASIVGQKEMYFFSLRDRKYPTGLRTNRATNAGYWKTTGKDKEIYQSGTLIGLKKTLVFYMGRAPKGEKSNWVMHEYRLHHNYPYKPAKEEWVVCRVFQKSTTVRKPRQDSLLDSPCDNITMVNDYEEVELSPMDGLTRCSRTIENNMDINMNWTSTSEDVNNPLLYWPSSLLASSASINSMLLAALQLRGYQASSIDLNDTLAQGNHQLDTHFGTSANFVDLGQQFHLDSIWQGC